jgi:septum formation protein
LRVLRQAGFDPVVAPADVDETPPSSDVSVCVRDLAYRKARAVATAHPDDVVLGCDSLVALGERILGKPASIEEARDWWREMRGGSVTVWTGHAVVHGVRSVTAPCSADVHFAPVLDAELEAYLATPEPMAAAGAFMLDGRAGLFVESINGDPGTVHGVSLSFLNAAFGELGIEAADLWA